MTTTTTPQALENFLFTCTERGELDDGLTVDAEPGAEDVTSETGWDFRVSLGSTIERDVDDVEERFREENEWTSEATGTSLCAALDSLVESYELAARCLDTRRAVGFWRLHDVRRRIG